MPVTRTSLAAALYLCLVTAAIAEPAATSVCCTAGAVDCGVPNYSGGRVALVIGSDKYGVFDDPGISDLVNGQNDARTIAAVLSGQKLIVRCLLDPTQQVVDHELTQLRQYLENLENTPAGPQPGGRVVVYVAGHGYRDPDDSRDYLLFRPETDTSKYAGIVDLSTLSGRVEQGRYSIEAIVSSFNNVKSPAFLFIFDACRSVVKLRDRAGIAVRGQPAEPIPIARLVVNRAVAYSTRPGSVAADTVPLSIEHNGLYASFLGYFLDQPGIMLNRAFTVISYLVQAHNSQQIPQLVNQAAFVLDKNWVSRPASGACELLNAAIWSNVGECTPLRDPNCIRQDICPQVAEWIKNRTSSQERSECLSMHREKWLRVDLENICGSARTSIRPPYSVVPVSELTDTIKISLAGYGSAAGRLNTLVASSGVPAAAVKAQLDRALSDRGDVAKIEYTNIKRPELITPPIGGRAPERAAASPFEVNLSSRSITVRNLPSASALAIGTFGQSTVTIEIDCQTVRCFGDWIGVRVRQNEQVLRGWVSVEDLRTVTTIVASLVLEYDQDRVVPREQSLGALERLARRSRGTAGTRRRIQLIGERGAARSDSGSLLANARLAFLSRALRDWGVDASDVLLTMAEVQGRSAMGSVTVNFGRSELP
jgi:hypothetical protein